VVQEKASYRRFVECSAHLLEYFSKKPIYALDADDCEHYRLCRQEEGAAAHTVDLELGLLGAMFRLARRRKKIASDAGPVEFASGQSKAPPRRVIDEEEFEAICCGADEEFRDVLLCGHETAMRSSEIAGLRAYQVHLDETCISGGDAHKVDYIDLGEFDTKTRARRTVPVSSTLKEVLKKRLNGLQEEEHVFARIGQDGKRKPYTKDSIKHKFRFCCKRAGITYGDKPANGKGERVGVVFHCLRHTRTSKWVEMGFSDEIIRRATGHRTLEAYRKYVHLDPAAVMRLVSEGDKNGTKSPQSLARG
jgi:integrase